MAKKYNILLLTNRDSDNVGDQVIEACDIALIRTVMKNLNIKKSNYEISSRAAAIITKKYVKTKNTQLLKTADDLIKKTDVIVFGGAPVFNYLYQIFYERTATTLEIAQKYHKPVIFSAIGVERYEETNEKCQRLKKTLNFDCVKQITTRDGIEELTKYKEREDLVISRVSDPAVFTAQVFREHNIAAGKIKSQKKIGIFVFRANGFIDNKIDFTKDDAAKLWKDLVEELESKGYDYTLLTSGHFGDEAFLDYLIREHGIKESKCVFNMNSADKLIKQISSFDAIISCRLHPSIIAFSLDVPALGLIWNSKVKHFYECIGYKERGIEVQGINAKTIIDNLEQVMVQGVAKDEEYLMSVYRSLFYGIQRSLNMTDKNIQPYDYDVLIQHIPVFPDTSVREKEEKLKRKFRRVYETLNVRMDKNKVQEEKIKNLREITSQYTMFYHTGEKGKQLTFIKNESEINGTMNTLPTGALECKLSEPVNNDGSNVFLDNIYQNGSKEFCGWKIRFRIGQLWFWYLEDELFCRKGECDEKMEEKMKLFHPGDSIPYLPFPGVESVVVEARWH